MSCYSETEIRQLVESLTAAGCTPAEINALAKNQNGVLDSLILVLRGRAKTVSDKDVKSEDQRLADAILINGSDPTEMSCGMKYCPFHQWANLSGWPGPIESICTLPGDLGGNVLVLCPQGKQPVQNEVTYFANGCEYHAIARLPKCLKVKPPSKKKDK